MSSPEETTEQLTRYQNGIKLQKTCMLGAQYSPSRESHLLSLTVWWGESQKGLLVHGSN